METLLRLPRRATYADYLAVEQNSDHRHEFIDGVIVAMAGGSDEHNAIAGKLAGLVGSFELPTLSASIPVVDVYNRILDAAGASLLRQS